MKREILRVLRRNLASPETQSRFGALGSEVWVRTAAEAIEVLKSGNTVSISLDHDLGDDATAGTEYDVATWIEKSAFNELPKMTWSVLVVIGSF